MNELVAIGEEAALPGMAVGSETEFVTMTIADQRFGIPVLSVRDVLTGRAVTKVPLADEEVAGSLNLRGRIVTVIDVRRHLGLPPRDDESAPMNVVVEHEGELYSLMIDAVGEVMSMDEGSYERNPENLDPLWRDCSSGVYRLEGALLVVLDVARLLEIAD